MGYQCPCALLQARNCRTDPRQGQVEKSGRQAGGMLSVIFWQCANRAHVSIGGRQISALSVHQEGRPQLPMQDTAWLPARTQREVRGGRLAGRRGG